MRSQDKGTHPRVCATIAVMGSCVLLHGAGSRPEFIRRAFGPTLQRYGWQLIAPDVRGADMADMRAVIAELATGADVVGGVSLGAHAAASFVSATGWSGGLFAVMPAWIGSPGEVAALTAHTADEVEALGVEAVVGRIIDESGPDDWVARELRAAWASTCSSDLAHHLRVAAAQPSPGPAELRSIRARTVVVALADDPLHPERVARQWADTIPAATLEVLPRMLGSPSELGRPLEPLLDAIGSR